MAKILIRLRILVSFKHIKLCLVMQQRCLGLVYHRLSWPRMFQGSFCELITMNSGIRRVQRASKGLPWLGSYICSQCIWTGHIKYQGPSGALSMLWLLLLCHRQGCERFQRESWQEGPVVALPPLPTLGRHGSATGQRLLLL